MTVPLDSNLSRLKDLPIRLCSHCGKRITQTDEGYMLDAVETIAGPMHAICWEKA
jgi:hypothetical protein